MRIAWVIWGLIGVVAVGYSVLRPGNQGAYPLFRDTGSQWIAGAPLYDRVHGNSLEVYRYSPLIAVFFVPLAMLPLLPGMALLHGINLGVFLVGLRCWGNKVLEGGGSKRAQLLLLSAVIGGGVLVDAQLRLVTLGLMLIGMAALEEDRWFLSALAIALSACIKAYTLSLGLVLALVYPRRFAPWFGLSVLLLLALPFGFQSPAYVLEQYRDWLCAGLNQRYQGGFQDVMSLWNTWIGPMDRGVFTLVSVAVGAAVALVAVVRRRALARDLHICIFGLCSIWMTAFGPATEARTYVALAPLVALATVRTWTKELPFWARQLTFVVFSIFVLAQLQLIFPLNKPLFRIGALPVAALLLAPVFAFWKQQRVKEGLVLQAAPFRRAA
ncbi:MAG TPA: glycosyltransferase family 87 protein [Gemmataceae bacterium]|nr:glycosyltransferase family 87 protein [Gemmataceae bacterium]